ncbi:MAG: energy transducer TonB [Candidatus Eremiobacteraeota bacterium]|nr:energy transducer TonB [Candidatus Eremiobacteraeota bacterium]
MLATVLAAVSLSAGFTGSLGGASLDIPVLSVVRSLGMPSLVQSTDDGQEWRWFNARGLDVDLLADDALTVHQILASRPEAVEGKPFPLVQPAELPLLEAPLAEASKALTAAGGRLAESGGAAVALWRFAGAFVALQPARAHVAKILVLDEWAARRFGYFGSGVMLGAHRAPRLTHQPAVDYPHAAIASRAQGVVIVRVDVAASGAVKNAVVLLSSGNSDIDAAEMQSMRRSSFRPARCDGQPCDGVFLDREEYTLGE